MTRSGTGNLDIVHLPLASNCIGGADVNTRPGNAASDVAACARTARVELPDDQSTDDRKTDQKLPLRGRFEWVGPVLQIHPQTRECRTFARLEIRGFEQV